jgi:hypothetical protein
MFLLVLFSCGMAAQKMVRASPAVADAGLFIMNICKRAEAPVAAQNVGRMSPTAVSAGSPPG